MAAAMRRLSPEIEIEPVARDGDTVAAKTVLMKINGDARAVLSGMHGGTTRANVGRAALEGIAWRVADSLAVRRFVGLGLDAPAPVKAGFSVVR